MLFKRNITVIGTVRKNKPSTNRNFGEKKGKERYSSIFIFTKCTTLVSYILKKDKCIVLQNTLHKNDKVEQNIQRKLEIIIDYNKTKEVHDTLDKMPTQDKMHRQDYLHFKKKGKPVVSIQYLNITTLISTTYLLFCTFSHHSKTFIFHIYL